MMVLEALTKNSKIFKLKEPLSDDISGDLEADITSLFPMESWDVSESQFLFEGQDWSIEYKPSGKDYVIVVTGPNEVFEQMKEILDHYKVEYVV